MLERVSIVVMSRVHCSKHCCPTGPPKAGRAGQWPSQSSLSSRQATSPYHHPFVRKERQLAPIKLARRKPFPRFGEAVRSRSFPRAIPCSRARPPAPGLQNQHSLHATREMISARRRTSSNPPPNPRVINCCFVPPRTCPKDTPAALSPKAGGFRSWCACVVIASHLA